MADIFLSYSSQDEGLAESLKEVLERQGWSVWWNYKIRVGAQFDLAIVDELENAKCVLVMLSRQSVKSPWVRGEADVARTKGKPVIPALIDDVELPLEFRLTETADLSDWKGDLEHRELERLLKGIGELLQHPPRSFRGGPSGVDTRPVKAIPVSHSELERVRRHFRFFSPTRRSYEAAAPPEVGEEWRLERTLPSGLYLGLEWTKLEEAYDFFRYFLRLPAKRFEREGYDFRKFQYDVERHQREHPLLYADERWETCSVSWHPIRKLLVTAGTGNQAKLWDVTTGDLITENPCWSSYSSGRSISWSDDAELFLVDQYSFDGRTGELLRDAPRETSDWSYSSYEYDMLRGPASYRSGGVSHLASTHNFSPFRPNSGHHLVRNSEKNLILRNRLTGAVEREIDCDVPSNIKDFAWHPKGQFIAVAFEGHDARLIDADEVRTVDSLSARHLVGWSPDGRTLVLRRGREKGADDLVAWDAVETEERPLDEGMKNKLWFKRFFDNISADGLRHIRIEGGEGRVYSVASDELVATLPNPVTAAAWCPTNGGLLATCAGNKTHVWSI